MSPPLSRCLNCLGGAAADGEVLAADRDVPPVDLAEAHDVRRRREPGEAPVLVLPGPGEDADLVEGAGVEDAVEALADGVLPAIVLAGDAVRLAAGARQLDAFPELVEPVLPHHAPAPRSTRPRAPSGARCEGSVLGEGACYKRSEPGGAKSAVGRSAGSDGSRISMPVTSSPSISITVACSRSVVKPVSPPYQPMWRHTPSSRE